ncbi:hypothetical protein RHECNPAF_890041 [Rhizobium etli CNPAF512]|nr:hypothetical protein RHECNPAF_890041 [Rhizobium etli CNPAF512]
MRRCRRGRRCRPTPHNKKGRVSPAFVNSVCPKRLTLGELEGAAGLCLAVLLAFDDAAVAGQEAALLQHRAQARLEVGERLGQAMANGTGLAGEAAAGNGCDDVELAVTGSRDDRLAQDHLQHRAGEIVREFLAVDDDLAGARLDPDAGDGVLALAGRVGAAERIDLADVRRSSSFGSRAEILQGGEVSHDQALLTFFLLSAATSRATGCWASWGWLAPA